MVKKLVIVLGITLLVAVTGYARLRTVRSPQVVDSTTFARNRMPRSRSQSVGSVKKLVDCDSQYYAQAGADSVHDVSSEDISISAWVKISGGGSGDIITKKGNVGAGYSLSLLMGILSGIVEDDEEDAVFIIGSTDIRDGVWHHVCMIVDRDLLSGCLVFLDGVDDTSVSFGDVSAVGSVSNSNGFLISSTSGFSALGGRIADVKIYCAGGACWSGTQIAYQAVHPFDYSPSAGPITEYWKATEGSGLILDGSAGNDLTLSSSNVWVMDEID